MVQLAIKSYQKLSKCPAKSDALLDFHMFDKQGVSGPFVTSQRDDVLSCML